MAQQVHTQFIDDIDGSEAERTFCFAVDGVNYEIDLSTANITEFMHAIAGFIESARRVSGIPNKLRTGIARSSVSVHRDQIQAIRSWARTHGYSVSDRGRIPAVVLEAYHANGAG